MRDKKKQIKHIDSTSKISKNKAVKHRTIITKWTKLIAETLKQIEINKLIYTKWNNSAENILAK